MAEQVDVHAGVDGYRVAAGSDVFGIGDGGSASRAGCRATVSVRSTKSTRDATTRVETPAVGDGTGLAEALLGLGGFRVLAVRETPAEVVIEIETTAAVVGCPGCGVRAEAQDRMVVEVRDLACFGRPARLVWSQAAVALPGGVVRGADVDRDLRARLGAGGADSPRRDGGVPPGR